MSDALVLPGLVDLQVNGYAGVDFSSPALTDEAFVHACRRLREAGTAMFLPTVITSHPDTYARNLPILARVIAREEFRAICPGLHLEGPFISPEIGAVGAHAPGLVRDPDVGFWDRLFAWASGSVKMLTLAPERPGADAVARRAASAGVLVSAGHTLAGAEDLARLTAAGGLSFTHLGNALPPLVQKFDNPIWAALAEDGLTALVITDGHHVPAGVLKVMVRAKGAQRVVVVSDGSPIAGLPPGRYRTLGNDVVLESSGLLHNPDKGVMVGSSATMLQCMNYLASLGFLSSSELQAVGFGNPLRLIGLAGAEVDSTCPVEYSPPERRFSLGSERPGSRRP